MEKRQLMRLSKRERQIMDAIYMLGEGTAPQVLEHLLQTFFQGNALQTISALLDVGEGSLSEEDIAEIAELIRKTEAREKKGRS
jgi:hypothetical protein